MNERDAQELIRMAEANWHMDLGPARAMWRSELLLYDADLVTHALGELAKKQQYKITLADLMEIISDMARAAKRRADEERLKAAEDRMLKEGKRGYATPEWVWVWLWARTIRDPREDRSFPQQSEFADPRYTMTTTQYEELKAEWLAAGSPHGKIPFVGRAVA